MSDTNDFDLDAFMAETENSPEFDTEATDSPSGKRRSVHEVDLSQQAFEPIENVFLEEPTGVFDDPKYYKTVMSGKTRELVEDMA